MQHPPEALLPIGIVCIGVGDPVAVPGKAHAPERFIHLDLRAVAIGFHRVRIHGLARAFLRPMRQHILAEQAVLIGGGKALRAVNAEHHRFDLLRHRVRHAPARQRQVRIAPVADVFDPRLRAEPIQCGQPVRALVDVRLPNAFRAARAAAPLQHEPEAAAGVFLHHQLPLFAGGRIAAAHQDHRERLVRKSLRQADLGQQPCAVRHGQHFFADFTHAADRLARFFVLAAHFFL